MLFQSGSLYFLRHINQQFYCQVMVNSKVKVEIVHGNLSDTSYPVVTGRYVDSPLSDSERYLNWCLGGLLKERKSLSLYPADLGTSNIILKPGSYPGGCILVGLGNMGPLTPRSLMDALSRAFLTYIVRVAECQEAPFGIEDGYRAAPLTSLIMGLNYSSMMVEEVVMAILYAVYQANTSLSDSGYGDKVIINRLDLVEQWQDRAIHIAHAVNSVKSHPILADRFDFGDNLVKQGIGRLVRVTFYEQQKKTWRRLKIYSDGQVQELLHYEILSVGTRTEVSTVSMQTSLIDACISRVVANTAWEPRVGSILFELLVPLELKQRVRERHNLVLILDKDAARYPWELLNDQATDDARPFAITAGLLRKLQTNVYRMGVPTRVARALIIGNPHQTLMPDLPGAKEEAEAARELLLGYNYEVRLLTGSRSTSSEIIKTLYESSYRILHLAGHGVYKMPLSKLLRTDDLKNQAFSDDASVTGMIIGDGVFLTVAEIAQMPYVPELVFINCCYLGYIEHQDKPSSINYPKLAANLATQFISIGVRVVIAAGWQVDDKAGKAFAMKLYKDLLSGKPLGQAVLDTRRQIYEAFSGVDTWGAFQIYGDEDFYLAERNNPTDVPNDVFHDSIQFYERGQAVAALENLVGDFLLSTTSEKIDFLRKKLEKIERALPKKWKDYADVLAVLGWVYSESGQLDKAIDYYELALKSSRAALPVASIERLGELKSLLAIQSSVKLQGDPDGDRTKPLIAEGIEILQGLCSLTPNVRCYSLLGDTYRRQVHCLTDTELVKAIENMEYAYYKAAELGGKSFSIKAKIILTKAMKYWLKGEGETKMIIQEAQQISNVKPIDFHIKMLLIEMEIVCLLLKEELELKVPEILQKYQHGFTHAASPLARIRNKELVSLMLDATNYKTFPESFLKQKIAIQRIHDALTEMSNI